MEKEARVRAACAPAGARGDSRAWSGAGSRWGHSPGRVLGGERNAEGAAGPIVVGIQEPLPVPGVVHGIVPGQNTEGEV